MANEVYICRVRTDLPEGLLQITDLKPNTSRRSFPYEKAGQSGYLGQRVENDTLAALAANATAAEYMGLAAYLIDHVIDNGSGVTITVTVANAAAIAFIAQADAGGNIDINGAMVTAGGAGAGTTLTNGSSTGSLTEVLKILAGGSYTLPSGSVVGALAAPLNGGSFNDAGYRQVYASGSVNLSLGYGDLATYSAATFTYSGVAGAAVSVYDASGVAL
jgi:hypothetical protein